MAIFSSVVLRFPVLIVGLIYYFSKVESLSRYLGGWKDNTHAVLFENEKDYSNFSRKVNSAPYYILDQFPNNEKDYIELVKHSKIILEKKFKTKVSDFSYESLHIFDSAIAKNRITYEFYFSDVYYYLVPFATEVVIKESNSQLKLFYSAKHDTVEPHILLSDARIINVFIDLYEIPMESWETFRIYNTVQLRLGKL